MRRSWYRFLLVPSSDRGGRQGTMLTTGLRFHPEYGKISRSRPFLRNNPLRLNQIKCFREKMFWCSRRGMWLTNWRPTSDGPGEPWWWHVNSRFFERDHKLHCAVQRVPKWNSGVWPCFRGSLADYVLNFNEKKKSSLPWLCVLCDGR